MQIAKISEFCSENLEDGRRSILYLRHIPKIAKDEYITVVRDIYYLPLYIK